MANNDQLQKLKSGSAQWNSWKYENREASIDLSGADLSGAGLSDANLSDADLSGAGLSGANLTEADLTEANLSGAGLSKANLSEANLYGVNLSEANLSEANLTGADLSEADLSKANLTGANLSETNLTGVDLSEANLTGVNLTGANIGSVRITIVACNFIPKGWLACDGSELLIKDHENLYNAIVNQFGGDGETTFKVPDLKDKAPLKSLTCIINSQTTDQKPFLSEVRLLTNNEDITQSMIKCDGSLLPINDHTALFSLIGTLFGGDGRTTFAVPKIDHPGLPNGYGYHIYSQGLYPSRS